MHSPGADRTGAAIRKLRLARGWNLATLSERTGVPISTLSRAELGQNSLKYDKLVRLCQALDVDIEGMVARDAGGMPVASGRRAVIRAGEGDGVKVGASSGVRGASDLLSKSFTPVVLDVTAASVDDHGPLVDHPGEAYVMALSGTVVLHSVFYAPLVLGAGDAVYFDASSGYALTAQGGPSRALLIASGEVDFRV